MALGGSSGDLVLEKFLLIWSLPGGIAQLVEHLHGMQGVRGSNPLTSTNHYKRCLERLECRILGNHFEILVDVQQLHFIADRN